MENRNCPWLTLASLGPFMKRELLVLLLGAWAAHPVIVVTSVVFRLDSRRVGVQPAAAVRAREAVAVFLFVGVLSPPRSLRRRTVMSTAKFRAFLFTHEACALSPRAGVPVEARVCGTA
jgi:hypothetical protein